MRRAGQSDNILQFPGDASGGGNLKAFAVVFYCFLALMLANPFGMLGIMSLPLLPAGFAGDDGIWILFMLGLVYYFFVRRRIQQSPYLKHKGILIWGLIVVALLVVLAPVRMAAVLLISGLYWLMIERGSRREAPYFLRFHIATAIVLDFLLLLAILVGNEAIQLAFAIISTAHLTPIFSPVITVYTFAMPFVILGLYWGFAIWLSVSAIGSRTPYIPLVTPIVRGLI